MTDIPTITQEEAVEVRARELLAVEHDNAGFTVSGAVIRDARAHRLNDLSEGNKLAIRAIAKALSPNMDHAVGGVLARRIAEVMGEGDGAWTACSGCQESVDGSVSTKDYPYDPTFKCQPGGGCGECGGIGVTWTPAGFYDGYAEFAEQEERTRDNVIAALGRLDVINGAIVGQQSVADDIVALRESTPPVNQDAVREALDLARPIVEADLATANEYADGDWIGMSQTALDAIDTALATPPLDNTGLDAATVERCAKALDRHWLELSKELGMEPSGVEAPTNFARRVWQAAIRGQS